MRIIWNRISFCFVVVAAVCGLATSPARAALIYNAGAALLANEKPDGGTQELINPNPTAPVWSYGIRSTATGTGLTLFTAADHVNATGPNNQFDGFANSAPGGCCGALPHILVNTGPAIGNPEGSIPTGDLSIHPNGDPAGNFAGEEKGVVRFTTAVAGAYAVSARWEDVNDCCGQGISTNEGVDVHAVKNGVSLFDASISREADDSLPTFTTFNQTVFLNVGDTLDFVVGTNGQLYGDETQFNATLTQLPEPSSVVGLAGIGGIGLVFAARRRFRRW